MVPRIATLREAPLAQMRFAVRVARPREPKVAPPRGCLSSRPSSSSAPFAFAASRYGVAAGAAVVEGAGAVPDPEGAGVSRSISMQVDVGMSMTVPANSSATTGLATMVRQKG